MFETLSNILNNSIDVHFIKGDIIDESYTITDLETNNEISIITYNRIRLKKDAIISKELLFYICVENKLSLTIIDKDNNTYKFINGNWDSVTYKDYMIKFEYDSNGLLVNRKTQTL